MNDITLWPKEIRLEPFAREICCIADQVLLPTSLGANKESLNMLLGESLKGDCCRLVIEETNA